MIWSFFKCLIATFFPFVYVRILIILMSHSNFWSIFLSSLLFLSFFIHRPYKTLLFFSQSPVLHKVIFRFIASLHSVVDALFYFIFDLITRDLVLVWNEKLILLSLCKLTRIVENRS